MNMKFSLHEINRNNDYKKLSNLLKLLSEDGSKLEREGAINLSYSHIVYNATLRVFFIEDSEERVLRYEEYFDDCGYLDDIYSVDNGERTMRGTIAELIDFIEYEDEISLPFAKSVRNILLTYDRHSCYISAYNNNINSYLKLFRDELIIEKVW